MPQPAVRLPSCLLAVFATASLAAAEPHDLGSRRELFVDRHQIESMSGSARLKLHSPAPAEICLKFDSPWDGATSTYVTVFQDGDKVRMYYRGSDEVGADGKLAHQHGCYAESTDGGRTFVKPKLGLFEFAGSKENNIVVPNRAHNFSPFKDERPGVPNEAQYKAVMTGGKGLVALYSPDGLHWERPFKEAVLTQGEFDSHNLAFWDANLQKYRSYYRVYPNKIRDVAVSTSDDFEHWTDQVIIQQSGDEPREQFYTNATVSYFRAPHMYFSFPKRLVHNRVGLEGYRGVSDAKFMSSRDGLQFDRTFHEAFIRPGRDTNNWSDRGTMPAWGLVQTGPDEMSVYYTQHYRHKTAHMRRGVLRLDGIASLHGDGKPGTLLTKPLTFSGKKLTLNYATSASGNVQVELLTADGKPVPGFTLKDAPEAFGDKIDAPFAWKNGTDVSSLAGKPVRLRFTLRDADVYSYCFTE